MDPVEKVKVEEVEEAEITQIKVELAGLYVGTMPINFDEGGFPSLPEWRDWLRSKAGNCDPTFLLSIEALNGSPTDYVTVGMRRGM